MLWVYFWGYILGYNLQGTEGKRSPGVCRLRAYAGRLESGSPICVSEELRANSKAADAALRELVARVEGEHHPERQSTFAHPLARWLDHIGPQRTLETMQEYRRLVTKDSVPAVGAHRIDRLSAEHGDRAYAAWVARGAVGGKW